MSLKINGKRALTKTCGAQLNTISINLTGSHRIPVPHPNFALARDFKNLAKHVFYNSNAIATKKTYCSQSYGDEAGQHGGVISGTVNGKATFITASNNVFINGIPAVRSGDKMQSNSGNTPIESMII